MIRKTYRHSDPTRGRQAKRETVTRYIQRQLKAQSQGRA